MSVSPSRRFAFRSFCSSCNCINDRNSLLPHARLYSVSNDKQYTNGNLGPAACCPKQPPSYLQLQVYIQACNDVTTCSLSYCIVFYIAAKYKTGPEFILHSASYGTTSFALIYKGIFPKNYVCNAAQVIYHIAYTLGTFLHFLVKMDFEVY